MGGMGWSGQPERSWVAWVGQVSLNDHGWHGLVRSAWTIMGSMDWSGQPERSWVAWVGWVSLDDHG